jgi:tRNA nucleotidyltransferase/poly(A) polymerase
MTKLETISQDLKSQDWMATLLRQSKNVFLVGGIVRDSFLSKSSKDIDLIVEGLTVDRIQTILNFFGSIDEVGQSFKVLKFKPWGFKGEPFDIATPRKDVKIGDGHKGIKALDADTIEEDLLRRDFTINSMAFNIQEETLLDPFNGLADIDKSLLRATDTGAFVEDPLRIVRGVQFASRFSFEIEKDTLHLMKSNSNLINEITGERIFDELNKILLKDGDTKMALELFNKSGLSDAIFGQELDGFRFLGPLDPLSFFFVLADKGGKKPGEFCRNFLRGPSKMIKALEDLQLVLKAELFDDEDKFRLVLLNAIQRSPSIEFSNILSMRSNVAITLMNSGSIPKKNSDILINGFDIQNILGVKGTKIGDIVSNLKAGALINKFDWTNKEKSIDFLLTLD